MPVDDTATVVLSEPLRVVLRRYREARIDLGLTDVESRLYAESSIDCSDLRRLVRMKCPPAMAAKILL